MSLYPGDSPDNPNGHTDPVVGHFGGASVVTSDGRTNQILLAIGCLIAFAVGWMLYRSRRGR